MYKRTLETKIENRLFDKKAIVLIGPRQVGKTTLLKEILNKQNHQYLFLNGDDIDDRLAFSNKNTSEIKQLIGEHKIVFIDEAQRIENVGLSLKIITDQIPDVQLIVSGSSALDIANKLNEPLTGRKWEYILYPISWEEYESKIGFLEAKKNLNNRVLFGFYPDVINSTGREIETLKTLTNSYLYKDIFALSGIQKPSILEKLVTALALQIGSEVKFNELSNTIGLDVKTIEKYIQLLEKAYIVFRLGSFSRNLRNEIKKNNKIFFYDNGIRNAVLSNFTPLALRSDKGALWENFLVAERIKQNAYKNILAKNYFWRTTQQQEIDLVEEYNGQIYAFEFKWSPKKTPKISKSFRNAYNAKEQLVNTENFRDFVIIPENKW